MRLRPLKDTADDQLHPGDFLRNFLPGNGVVAGAYLGDEGVAPIQDLLYLWVMGAGHLRGAGGGFLPLTFFQSQTALLIMPVGLVAGDEAGFLPVHMPFQKQPLVDHLLQFPADELHVLSNAPRQPLQRAMGALPKGSFVHLEPADPSQLADAADDQPRSGNDAANRDHGRRDSQTNSHDQPDQQGNKRYEPGEQRQTTAYDLHQSYGSLAAGSGIKHGKVFLFLHDRGLDLPVNGSGRRGRGTGGGFHRLADGFASHIYGLAHGLTDRLVQLLKVPGIDGSVHNVLNASSKIVPVLIFICHTILSKKYSLSL